MQILVEFCGNSMFYRPAHCVGRQPRSEAFAIPRDTAAILTGTFANLSECGPSGDPPNRSLADRGLFPMLAIRMVLAPSRSRRANDEFSQ
jgi:hypothetical protein